MRLVRVHNGNAEGWALYPVFEARVIAMRREFELRGLDGQFRLSLQKRWVELPDFCAYFLATEDDRVVAHTAAWVETQYGVPYVLIYQCKVDRGFSIRPVLVAFFTELNVIINKLNGMVPAGAPRITEVDFWTPWEPELWERLLHMADVRQHYNVMRINTSCIAIPAQELLS